MATDLASSNKRIAKNTAFLYLRLVFVLVVSLYTTRVILNVLGQEDYGIYNVVGGFVSMFAFINSAMSNGIQRFFNYERAIGGVDAAKTVYNHALVIQFLIALTIVLLTETVGIWYLENKMIIPSERFYAAMWVFQLSIISLVIVVFTAPYTAAVMSHEKMGYFAFVSVLDAILKLIFIFLLQYITFDKLIFYSFLQVIISLTSFVLYFVYCHKYFSEIRFCLSIRKDIFMKMLGFSGWNLFGTLAYTIKGQGLNLLLNAFFGPIVNAARGISFQILTALQGFTSNIFISFRPQLIETYAKKDYVRTRSLMYTMSKMTFYLLYLFTVPIILEINYILYLWLGDNIPQYTVPFTILILFNTLISNFNTPLSLVVHATGRMKNYQLITSLIIILILPLSWIALRNGASPISVYWVSLGVVTINQVVCLLLLKRIFEFTLREYTSKVIFPSIIVFISAPLLPILIQQFICESFIRFIVIAFTSLLSTATSIYIAGLTQYERSLVNNYMHKIWKRFIHH